LDGIAFTRVFTFHSQSINFTRRCSAFNNSVQELGRGKNSTPIPPDPIPCRSHSSPTGESGTRNVHISTSHQRGRYRRPQDTTVVNGQDNARREKSLSYPVGRRDACLGIGRFEQKYAGTKRLAWPQRTPAAFLASMGNAIRVVDMVGELSLFSPFGSHHRPNGCGNRQQRREVDGLREGFKLLGFQLGRETPQWVIQFPQRNISRDTDVINPSVAARQQRAKPRG
jgi:hypothetical protein